MTMGERIRLLRISRGWSQGQLADMVGKTEKAVSFWENDKYSPRMGVIETLSKVFNVSKAYIVDGDEDDTFRAAFGLVPRASINYRRVPILGDTAAGEPIVANRVYDEYIDVPDEGPRYDAVLRVVGDSMAPRYVRGDLVFVRYQPDVEDGEIVVIGLDDEVTLKRLIHVADGILLLSENRNYPPRRISHDDYNSVHLIGLVVGVLHWEK
jgi:repressor LexA